MAAILSRPQCVNCFPSNRDNDDHFSSTTQITMGTEMHLINTLRPGFNDHLHFQYGRRRPSWILMVGLVKKQERCQKWTLHAKISRKSGITQLSISICLQVTFPIWPPAAILDFGFSQIPPPFWRGSWGLNFFLHTSKSSSQVSNLTMLSVVTGSSDCTPLYGLFRTITNAKYHLSQSILSELIPIKFTSN